MTIITVNGKPFFGRVEEQKQFRAALQETLQPPRDETLPYVILLYGDGGIGKTTLARRFRDIVNEEEPFRGKVLTLWVDWEAERDRWSELQVGREHIRPETVFDVLYTLAARQGWEKDFEAYRRIRDDREKVEVQALQALQMTGERDELAALRGLGAEALAALVRQVLPIIGERGEQLTRIFLEYGIKVGAEQAYALRQSLEARLRSRLGVRQFDLYLNPHEALARALADGLKRISRGKALLVVLDTYEIVDRTDPWMRIVIQNAGPRVLWVLSGRNNLRDSRPYGPGYFRGYSEDFPRRLLAYDLAQLALQDVKDYFATVVPTRPLNEEDAEAIRRATRGIPLAVAQAAEMWARGVPLDEIVGDSDEAAPGREIVRKMTGRYLLHAVRAEDCRALYALALARGDLEVLRAMLAPGEGVPFDLKAELRRLERDYASVVAFEGRLHEEPQAFFLAHLREPLQRQSDLVRDLLARAETALRAHLARIEADFPLIEDRHADEDWRRTVLDLTEILFWQEEERAWPFLLARFVESLAYSAALRRGLLDAASRWEKGLSARGRRLLQSLRAAEGWRPPVEEEQALLTELRRALERGWLGGEDEGERRAILAWWEGLLLFRQRRYSEALEKYEEAERSLPSGGEALREHLAEAFEDVGDQLGWLRDEWRTIDAVASPEAEYAYQTAINLGRSSSGLYHALGAVQSKLGKHEASLQNRKKALEIDPKNVYAWNGLGVVYRALGRYEEAIQAYRQAIALDPKDAYPWNGLGNVYRDLGRYDEAIQACQQAIALDPKDAYPWNGLGNVYADLGRYDEAIQAYQQAIALDPKFALPWNGLGNVYADLGRYEEAIPAYQRAIALAPKFAYPWNGLGVVYCDLGRYEEAIQAYQQAIALVPKFAAPWNNLGNVYALRGEWEQALEAFRRAAELEPERGVYHASVASALRALGREAEAQEEIARARPLMEKENEYNRACFAAICGEREEALRLLEIALQKRQVSRQWARRDPDLRSLHGDPRFEKLVGAG
jgi:tetratricopeptide (TPR) repeat protein